MGELDRLFDLVLVRPPSKSYLKCVSSNPEKSNIDLTLAKEQHRDYVLMLKESGIKVIELEPLEGFPDSVFMQDPALLGSHHSVIGRFGETTRRGEEKALIEDLKSRRIELGRMTTINPPGTLEGGDVVVTDRGIFVGESSRTNSRGIRQLAESLPGLNVLSVETNLFHLLCGCSYLNDGTMMIVPELVDSNSFPGFRFIDLSKEDAYAADALYLGEGRVLIPSGYPKASKRVKEAGYRPVEVDVSEFWKGDGGVTCLSSPVYNVF